MTFRIGQKVVCVDDSPNIFDRKPPIVKGQIYEISGFETGLYDKNAIKLAGISDILDGGVLVRMIFRQSRFRPLVTTDISIFTAMLAPSPKQKVSVDAQ